MSTTTPYSDIIALNYSGAKFILRSPAHYQAMLSQPRRQTAEMRIGTLAHLATFQPKEYMKTVLQVPADAPDKPTQVMLDAYAAGSTKQKPETVARIEWWAKFNESITPETEVINAEEYSLIDDIATAAEDALASLSVDKEVWQAETVVTKPYNGITIKGRPDLVTRVNGKLTVIDLKTTKDAGAWSFSADINSYKLHLQAAFYLELTQAEQFILIAVEKEPPFAWATYVLDTASLEVGKSLMETAVQTYKQCLTFNTWPAYPTGLTEISIPKYALPTK
jgi:hypothetical protein